MDGKCLCKTGRRNFTKSSSSESLASRKTDRNAIVGLVSGRTSILSHRNQNTLRAVAFVTAFFYDRIAPIISGLLKKALRTSQYLLCARSVAQRYCFGQVSLFFHEDTNEVVAGKEYQRPVLPQFAVQTQEFCVTNVCDLKPFNSN